MSDDVHSLPRMQDDRLMCAQAALRRVPEGYRTISAREVVADENSHHFYRCLHLASIHRRS